MSGGRYALLVASSRFEDPGLARLVSPAEDVEALRRVLGDPAIGGFDVQTRVNRPAHEVSRAVEAFYADRRRDDMLLFYFTGHGLKDDRGRLYFAMTDTERRYLGATALAATFLHDVMERARSRCDVLMLDCCYSGAFATSRVAKGDPAIHTSERFAARGRAVLTASDSMQFSFDGDRKDGERPLSVFTGLVVEGLRTGAADRDDNGYVDVDELYDYVDERMHDIAPEQQPGKWQWDVQGRIVIANNPRSPGTALTPPPTRIPRGTKEKPRLSRRTLLFAAGGAAAVTAGAGVWGVTRLLSDDGPRPWFFQTGGELYSSPAVDGGVVFVGSTDRSLYAVDLATGTQRWRYIAGGPITSSPAVANGVVYVGCNDGNVHAVDAATGGKRWTFATDAVIHSSPAFAAGTVFVGSRDHNVYAIDAATGEQRWKFTGGDWFNSSPTVAAASNSDSGTVYIGCRDHNVYALDAATGTRRWNYTTTLTVDCSAAVSGTTVWIGSDDQSLYALDARTGKWIWQFRAEGGIVSSPALDGDVVYVGSDDKHLYAVSASTGRPNWRYPTGNGIRSSPAVEGETVYVGSRDRGLHAVDTMTGQARWTYLTRGPIDDSSPVLASGYVLVGSLDHRLYAVRATDGAGP
ncbi:PQQ-binding-like beta-propeller repeat protein [Amycolatopsis sp. NPDC058986]|uniref:caspase, EACC1-associated type n=1 Tax=unclassified Amycolatopsis TaxID=2618356 RepID=UPI003672DE60